jgi:hypothetical protein
MRPLNTRGPALGGLTDSNDLASARHGMASSGQIDDAIPQIHLQDLGIDADGQKIVWPDLEGYDEKHGMNTAKLALVILSYTWPELNNDRNQAILWCAALLHDIGRQEDFRTPDTTAASRSAELANRILRNPVHGVELDGELREGACKLIANLDVESGEMPKDALAQALWDAEAYEYSRLRPNTYDGLKLVKKYTAPELLCTAWAKDRNNLKRYMDWRGW